MAFERIAFDLEATGLLDDMIDFSQRPLKLKDDAKLWCISVRCIDTNDDYMFIPQDILDDIEKGVYDNPEFDTKFSKIKLLPLNRKMLERVFQKAKLVVGHNIVKYDLPVLKLFGILDYEIGYPYYEEIDNKFKNESTINGKPVEICDTLVWSKILNPDRFGGHGLKNFGIGDSQKLDFKEFSVFSKEMIIYAQQDTVVSVQAYNTLMEEKGDHLWDAPYRMELKLADLAFKQELFGFEYDSKLSESNKKELDALLEERYKAVTPNIPPKPLNKGEAKQWTPPSIKTTGKVTLNDKVKAILDSVGVTYDEENFVYEGNTYPLSYIKSLQKYIPPAKKKAKSGALTSAMKKFLESIGSSYNPVSDSYEFEGTNYPIEYEGCVKKLLEPPETSLSSHMEKFLEKIGATYEDGFYTFEGKKYPLEYDGCVKETIPADIKDLTHLKGYIISLGWEPSQWNIRDLTRDSKKKVLPEEKFYEVVERYITDTFEGPFKAPRLRELDLPEDTTREELRAYLTSQYKPAKVRPIRVPTTPPFRVGATKELCPNLQKLADDGTIPFVKDMVEYFTYQHRRNSIAGGIDEDGEPSKGFESYVRTDNRISTPVDSLATSTSRMAHRIVNNSDRSSKLKEDFIEKAIKKFSRFFDYSKIIYTNQRGPITIGCPIHGDFVKTPGKFLRHTHGCSLCKKEHNLRDILYSRFGSFGSHLKPDLTKTVFRDTLQASDIYGICEFHGGFKTSFGCLAASKYCCPQCAEEARVAQRITPFSEFVANATKIHSDKYRYDEQNYSKMSKSMDIWCNSCEDYFSQRPYDHVGRAHGCPRCAIQSSRSNLEEFVVKAVKVHGDKYDYSEFVYTNSKTKSKIFCKKHKGFFELEPGEHLNNKTGCPTCAKHFTQSRAEFELIEYLKSLGLSGIIHDFRLGGKSFDICIPSLKLLIEYNGTIYHHYKCYNSDTYQKRGKHDMNYHRDKFYLAKANGYSLIHIFEFEGLDEWKATLTAYVQEPEAYSIKFINSLRYHHHGKLLFSYYGQTAIVKQL